MARALQIVSRKVCFVVEISLPEVLRGLGAMISLVLALELVMIQTYLRNRLPIETHHNSAKFLVAMLNVKIDLYSNVSIPSSPILSSRNLRTYLVGNLWALRGFRRLCEECESDR